jgi:uncharacterized protein YbjT (DUF2867 family)
MAGTSERRPKGTAPTQGETVMVEVTGATGNIGRHLVAALAAAGVGVRAVARRPPDTEAPEGVEYRAAEEEVLVSPDVDEVLGRAPRTFADWAARNAAAFR